MVSEFLTADDGRLRYQHSITGVVEQACRIITYGSGKSDDGYWTAEKMTSQVKKKAIPILQKRFPGKKAIFAFDNSSGHAAFAKDALVASRMNLNPGGAQPKMQDTVFAGETQRMVFSADGAPFPDLIGQPKGIRRVVTGRGLWVEGIKKRCVKKRVRQVHVRKVRLVVLFKFLKHSQILQTEYLFWKRQSGI